MFQRILVSTDGSKLSMKAVRLAIRLAKSAGAQLTALNVTPEYPQSGFAEGGVVRIPAVIKKRYYAESAAASNKFLAKIRASAAAAGVECKTISVPALAPYQAIIAQAKKSGSDLIVMGSHGRGGISRLLLGSETNKVLAHSTIPVLVIR